MRRKKTKRRISWPKPFTKALTREQIEYVFWIYSADKIARQRQGFTKGSYGLRARLAKEFKVRPGLIRDITTDAKFRIKRRRFLDLDVRGIRREIKDQLTGRPKRKRPGG